METGQKVPFVYIKYKILDRFLASEYTVGQKQSYKNILNEVT